MSQVVREFYNSHVESEWQRLETPLCDIEFASTLRLVDRYFPQHGQVADVGSGPGRYALELLRRGYTVTLFDLSKEELLFAQRQIEKAGLCAEQLIQGDARDMSGLATGAFEAALLMGPMYHVIEATGREKVLRELWRILKPGGTTIIAYLNSWGLIRTGVVDFPNLYRDPAFLRSMLDEHIFKGRELSGFTECYWSTPEVALSEVEKAGLDIVSYAGAEGFAGGMQPLLARLAVDDPEAYANVVQVAAETCELRQYRDSTDHLHIVARKKGIS